MSAYVGSSKNLKALKDLSTEGRVVGLCWANSNLKDLKDLYQYPSGLPKPLSACQKRVALLDTTTAAMYKGTSLTRNHHPPSEPPRTLGMVLL